jgi:hypothetical protein
VCYENVQVHGKVYADEIAVGTITCVGLQKEINCMNEYFDACWLKIDIKERKRKYYDLRRRSIKSDRKIEIWKGLHRSKYNMKYLGTIQNERRNWEKGTAEGNGREDRV